MENLSYLIIKASKLLKNNLDKKLSESDITAAQFSVLNEIAQKNGNITSSEVASSLSSDRPTISGIINRLEEKKLLEKVYNPEDKRSVYLKLNEEALELLTGLREISHKLNEEIFRGLKDEELQSMKNSLLLIIEKIGEK